MTKMVSLVRILFVGRTFSLVLGRDSALGRGLSNRFHEGIVDLMVMGTERSL